MARSDRSRKVVEELGATAVPCALGAVEAGALEDVDAVVHAAARAEDWGTRAQFWAANVDGTKQLLDVARRAGVKRFVFVGTEAALFDGRDLVDVDETYPYPTDQRFLYSETKAEAERLVLAANADGFTTISIRPRFVWGPRDQSILPTVVEMIEKKNFSWIDGGTFRTSTTHVANLVHAIELALEKGRGGEAYFVADEGTPTLRDFLTRYVETQGVTAPAKSLPKLLARPGAVLVHGLWSALAPGRRPPLTRFAIYMMSANVTVRCDKAKAELGYTPVVGVEEGLAAMAGARRGLTSRT
jgi:nucleoside-diphosphate-sugar epimerase